MSEPTHDWWNLLRAVSAFNLMAWLATALWLLRQPPVGGMARSARQWQLGLSLIYVLGCGYRSLLPVFDVQRLVMVDTWMSSVLVGRTVATVAELCFMAQWALLLREVSRQAGSGLGAAVARSLVPLILVAECCSWAAVLTTSNLGHVFEETLWGLCAAMLVASLWHLWPRVKPAQRRTLALLGAAGSAYVAYMFAIDVPMYTSRWLADEASGRTYLSLLQGLADISSRWIVSHRWDQWRSEVVWMSLYFSVAVWLSIALVRFTPAAQRPATPS